MKPLETSRVPGVLETHQLTPNMIKFFNHIFVIKQMVKNQIEQNENDKQNLFLKEILARLNSVYQMNEEIQ